MPVRFHRWILQFLGLALILLAFISEGFPGGADAINHFLISQRAFEHPDLFLDQWNKPLFTLVSAPFAQFGFGGVRVLNVMLGFISIILLYYTAKKDHDKAAIAIPFILLGMPVYTQILPSAMTEPLFGLLMAGSIWALRSNRIWLAALLIGLSPFARQEGYILIPFALAFMIIAGRWRQTLWLTCGGLLAFVAGLILLNDPKYLISSFPYGSAASDIYGHGTWGHFIGEYRMLFGVPNAVLISVGAVTLFVSVFTYPLKHQLKDPRRIALYFSLLVAATFLVGHTYLWATGSGGSVGLLRVIAAASPAFAYLAFQGWAFMLGSKPLRNPIAMGVGTSLMVVVLVFHLNQVIAIPFAQTPTENTIQELTDWGAGYDLDEGKIYYFDPSMYFFANGRMPLQHPEEWPMISGNTASRDLRPGDHVIWDAHFGPNEGRLPYDTLRMNPFMRVIKRFTPEISFNVLGGRPYQIVVFEMTDTKVVRRKRKRIRRSKSFEATVQETDRIVVDPLESDKCMVSDINRKYTTIRDTISAMEAEQILQMNIKAKVYWNPDGKTPEFSLVASIVDGENSLLYSGFRSDKMDLKPGAWNPIESEITLPPGLPDQAELVVYVWYINGPNILIDDLEIEEVIVDESPIN